MWRMVAIVTAFFIAFAWLKSASAGEPINIVDPNWGFAKSEHGCVLTFRPESIPNYVVNIIFVDGNTILGFTAPGVVYPPADKIKNVRVKMMGVPQTNLIPKGFGKLGPVNVNGVVLEHLGLIFEGSLVEDLTNQVGVYIYLESDTEMSSNGVYTFQWFPVPQWALFSACVAERRN